MKAVIQRVARAQVDVDGKTVGKIDRGLLVLFGAAQGDTEADVAKLADKVSKLRIFRDSEGKTNLSVNDIGGDILCVSQFTLLADCHKGNRPSFIGAALPDEADRLYRLFCERVGELIGGRVERGVFGADMKVSLLNDGPFTIVLECVDGVIRA